MLISIHKGMSGRTDVRCTEVIGAPILGSVYVVYNAKFITV